MKISALIQDAINPESTQQLIIVGDVNTCSEGAITIRLGGEAIDVYPEELKAAIDRCNLTEKY